jgi:hypothetical protein
VKAGTGGELGSGAGGAVTGGGVGKPGNSGGGGAFIFAATNGVSLIGDGYIGSGVGAIYGDLTLTGIYDVPIMDLGVSDPTLVTSINQINRFAHSAWSSLSPSDLWLNGGGGSGGNGGEGQILTTVPEPSSLVVLGLCKAAFIGLHLRRRRCRK